jgi:iron complex outermembrane receptor protein
MHDWQGHFGKTDNMAELTSSISGKKDAHTVFCAVPGGNLFTSGTGGNNAAQDKDSDTLTVLAGASSADQAATAGYQPLNTSAATLTTMPLLDIPQVVNTVSDKVLEDQHATTLDEALYNVSNVVQTNTLGGTQDAVAPWLWREPRRVNHDQWSENRLPRSFNAATSRVEVLKGPASTLYGILDPGGLINVVTKRPQTTFWRLRLCHLFQLWRHRGSRCYRAD